MEAAERQLGCGSISAVDNADGHFVTSFLT
jgi:hypothetical protein